MANTNCLAGMRCPNCGSEEGPLVIAAQCTAVVYDDGAEANDLDWNDESYCLCRPCGHEGTVRDFKED